MKQRNAQYDLMRVLAMVLVVMVHVPYKPFSDSPVLTNLLVTVLHTCNSIFFMLSGRLNLAKTFEKREDYILYYKKKIAEILLPFLLCIALLTLWRLARSGEPFTLLMYLKQLYRGFMGENVPPHLWFMHALAGMLLAAPFLAGMVQRLSDWALKLLLGLALGWNAVSIYFAADLGISFAYNNWFLSGWIIHFFAGYALYRLLPNIGKTGRWRIYAAALAGLLLTAAGKTLLPDRFLYSMDLSPLFVFWGIGVFTFLSAHPAVRSPRAGRVLRFIAKYSFLVYLIHYTVLYDLVLEWIPSFSRAAFSFLGHTALALALSFAAAFLLDLVLIKPLQRLLRKLLKIPSGKAAASA